MMFGGELYHKTLPRRSLMVKIAGEGGISLSAKRAWVVWLVLVVLVVLLGLGAYGVDRMALDFLTGPRRIPGFDYWGGPVRLDGPVPGFAFLGRLTRSEDLPGLKVVRPFEVGAEIGLESGDVITASGGKTFENAKELYQDFLRNYSAGDVVTLNVARETGTTRELRVTLKPFLRNPGDLGLHYEDVEIRSDSGYTLRGWYIPPPERGDGRAGVFVHGLWSSRFQALEEGAKFWHRRGYGLLTMDLSGHGASDGEYVTYSINERLDVESVIRWVRGGGRASPDKVVVFGTSAGAAAAIYAAAEDDELAALALDAPFSDLWSAAGDMLRLWEIPSILRYPLFLAVRRRAGIDLFGVRPIEVISQVRAPVLFVHGDADEQVPLYHSELMAEVRRREGLPTEQWILPGGEHGFDSYPPTGIFWNRVIDFFDRALGGPPPGLAL